MNICCLFRYKNCATLTGWANSQILLGWCKGTRSFLNRLFCTINLLDLSTVTAYGVKNKQIYGFALHMFNKKKMKTKTNIAICIALQYLILKFNKSTVYWMHACIVIIPNLYSFRRFMIKDNKVRWRRKKHSKVRKQKETKLW